MLDSVIEACLEHYLDSKRGLRPTGDPRTDLCRGWDLHVGQFDKGLSTNLFTLSNDLDRAVGSLAEDLKASGDLNQTLIVMMGEFGRTPGVLNSRNGRDHYRPVMSVAINFPVSISVTDAVPASSFEA